MKPYVVGISGASGVLYGLRFTRVLAELGEKIILTITDAARLVIQEEIGIEIRNLGDPRCLESLFDEAVLARIQYYHYRDLLAPVASGSFPAAGMVIIPCSVSSLSQIANGASQNLLERAADVTIKEGRRLVLVPRETPLSAIHLENMLKLARIGVRIVPANPGFYGAPQKIDDLVDFVVGKVLDQLGFELELFKRWRGKEPADDKFEVGRFLKRSCV